MDLLKEIYSSFYFLYSFKYLRDDVVMQKFLELLEAILESNKVENCADKFVSFVQSLNNQDFSQYISDLIKKNKLNSNDREQNEKELILIKNISKIQYQTLVDVLKEKFENYSHLFEILPKFSNSQIEVNLEELTQNESDIFKDSRTFIFSSNFEIEPVKTDEKLSFYDLKGYKEQKRVLFENTKALLSNHKVNNILLYGDAGCGKSSSVRALLNEFKELKIVQIFKNNLINLDKLYSKLKNIPYKFIIFADDISFSEDDETFSSMKASLEGALIQCPDNAVIYATSNRRHLVKESFQSRAGDEIHLRDTINEINSLSERFGINLLFTKPSNDEFCSIVLELAKDYNLEIPEDILLEKAQRLAVIKGSRSPRVAKQLINNISAGVDF